MQTIQDLRTPCYVVYKSILQRNAQRMRDRAEKLGCALRPHVKTCKAVEAAKIATNGRMRRICVSTLREAQFFADAGFDDILYTTPLTPDKLPEVHDLNRRLGTFHVMVDHPDQANALLASTLAADGKALSVFVCVDCGYHRDGVDPTDESSVALVRSLHASRGVAFAGLYTHGGHSYDAADAAALAAVGEAERDVTVGFARALRAGGVPVPIVGVGSTPTCSRPPAHLEGIDEMHPGNYVYYDMTQVGLGACAVEDVAVRVLTRVVGHYVKANTLLVDCGWTGASKQGVGAAGYDGFPEAPHLRLVNLKQECGEVSSVDGAPIPWARHPIGSMLAIAPYHSCAATHQHAEVHVLADDRATVLETWPICKGW